MSACKAFVRHLSEACVLGGQANCRLALLRKQCPPCTCGKGRGATSHATKRSLCESGWLSLSRSAAAAQRTARLMTSVALLDAHMHPASPARPAPAPPPSRKKMMPPAIEAPVWRVAYALWKGEWHGLVVFFLRSLYLNDASLRGPILWHTHSASAWHCLRPRCYLHAPVTCLIGILGISWFLDLAQIYERIFFVFVSFRKNIWVHNDTESGISRVAVISAKNHKRQRRKRQAVTAKREKSQTPKVLTAIRTLSTLT